MARPQNTCFYYFSEVLCCFCHLMVEVDLAVLLAGLELTTNSVARLAKKCFLFGHLFFDSQTSLAPKNGWGMLVYVPGWSLARQFWSYTPPSKVSFPAAKKMEIPHWKLFSWSIFFLKILAFYCLCGENFVTPFSTLAMIKGSLPTNSTTPDRLRSWTKTESEDFPGFWVRTLSKKSFFKRSTIESWSTPQKKPIAGFSWPEGQ